MLPLIEITEEKILKQMDRIREIYFMLQTGISPGVWMELGAPQKKYKNAH